MVSDAMADDMKSMTAGIEYLRWAVCDSCPALATHNFMPEAAKSTHTGAPNLQGMLSVIPFFCHYGHTFYNRKRKNNRRAEEAG